MSILARLAGGTTMKDPREGARGHNALTAEDINLAVSLLPPIDAAILMAGHIQQPPPPDQFIAILKTLEAEMYHDWKRQKLGRVEPSKLETMAEIAWAEFMTNDRLSEEQKALECEMSSPTWLNRYRRVYPAATGYLSEIERRAYSRVKRAIHD